MSEMKVPHLMRLVQLRRAGLSNAAVSANPNRGQTRFDLRGFSRDFTCFERRSYGTIGGDTKAPPHRCNGRGHDTGGRTPMQAQNTPGPSPSGLCCCGCGERTSIAKRTRRGQVRGKPNRFVVGHHSLKPPYAVDPDTGCWVWQRTKDAGGYGQQWDPVGARQRRAHAVYYEQAKGPIPDGLHIDHLCRNRACVNPAHLEAVTPAENSRRGKGTKLSLADVRAIRESSEPLKALGERFGVSHQAVSDVRQRRNWRDVA